VLACSDLPGILSSFWPFIYLLVSFIYSGLPVPVAGRSKVKVCGLRVEIPREA
jgi:hypothetical protein